MDFRVISLLIGYAFGLIKAAIIIGRLFYGIDILEHGSKNAGATNVNRIMGIKAGLLVFILDILKAVAAFVIATLLFDGGGSFFGTTYVLPGIYAGLGTVLGHNFPFYLKFKGGKGIACTLAIILMIDFRVALITFTMGVILVIIFRYISLASLAIVLLTPILMFFFGYMLEAVIVSVVLCILAWFMHRENIQKIMTGTERRFSFKKS